MFLIKINIITYLIRTLSSVRLLHVFLLSMDFHLKCYFFYNASN